MLYPLDCLLNQREFKDAFKYLGCHFDELTPYVGTGLSFYFKSWGEPFEIILNELKIRYQTKDFYRILKPKELNKAKKAISYAIPNNTHFKDVCLAQCLQMAINVMNKDRVDSKRIVNFYGRGCTHNNKLIWAKLDNLYKKQLYIELGELINIISETWFGPSFNKMFFRAVINKAKVMYDVTESGKTRIQSLKSFGNLEPLPGAIWYLPYLTNKTHTIFTTNTDNSINHVFESIVGRKPVIYHSKDGVIDIKRTSEDYNIVYHIHGYQFDDETDTSDTFIMTWKKYQDAYEKKEGSPLRMILDTARFGHFLFIGASLESDTTVDKMKEIAEELHATDKHVAFFKEGGNANEKLRLAEKRKYLNDNMATQTIIFPDWNQYSTVLCQLIREKTQNEWKAFEKALSCKIEADKAYLKEVSAFLDSSQSFSVYGKTINEDDLNTLLYPALKHYIVENGERSFLWSICHIDKDNFDFPIHTENGINRLDTYSAPLGNTIYIIGGRDCTTNGRDKLTNEIERWVGAHDKGYWYIPDGSNVKVRVFKVSVTGGLTPESIIKQLYNIVILKDEVSLLKLIESMGKYREYADIQGCLTIGLDKSNEEAFEIMITRFVVLIETHRLFQAAQIQLKLNELKKERELEHEDVRKTLKRNLINDFEGGQG